MHSVPSSPSPFPQWVSQPDALAYANDAVQPERYPHDAGQFAVSYANAYAVSYANTYEHANPDANSHGLDDAYAHAYGYAYCLALQLWREHYARTQPEPVDVSEPVIVGAGEFVDAYLHAYAVALPYSGPDDDAAAHAYASHVAAHGL